MNFSGRIAVLGSAAAFVACAANSPQTNFYALSAEPHAPAPAAPQAPIGVTIWQVSVPEVVDRRQLVVRTTPNRVDIADLHQWAEPLRLGIARVLADDLASRLGARYAVVVGQPAGLTPQVRVYVDMQQFEAIQGEGVRVEALWTVRPEKGEPRTGRSALQEGASTGDYGSIAAAYSRALARLARDIAPAVAALRPE